jgi:hypothetical protein
MVVVWVRFLHSSVRPCRFTLLPLNGGPVMSFKSRVVCLFVGVIVATVGVSLVFAADPTTPGTWQLYPPQSYIYSTVVQPPINADGTSNFKSNGKAVIPIQFSLSVAPGPVVFQSILSDGSDPNEATTNDYSFLSFTPSAALTFGQLTNLSAVYQFTQGNCHGGALRWSVRTSPTESLFIYYGAAPNFTDCTTVDGGSSSQSGVNMINRPELRYDTSQYPGGTFYDSYANAVALLGSTPIIRASLVLDGGWADDQVINPLQNVTVNDNIFVPASGGSTRTCELPLATIQITKTSGAASGAVNEPLTIQPNDDNLQFRIVDCKYMYNLATSSLSGVGGYKVEAVINGTPAGGAASFDLK